MTHYHYKACHFKYTLLQVALFIAPFVSQCKLLGVYPFCRFNRKNREPVFGPDGETLWKKSPYYTPLARVCVGVDLNRNFPIREWGRASELCSIPKARDH